MKELKWDFFDDSSCFVHDGLKINGTGPTRGLIATQDFNVGDKLIELTDQCLICPADILEETPGFEFNPLLEALQKSANIIGQSLDLMIQKLTIKSELIAK